MQYASFQIIPKKKTEQIKTHKKSATIKKRTLFVTVMEGFDSVCGGFSFVGDNHATENSSGKCPLPMLIHRLHTVSSSLSFVVSNNETLCLQFKRMLLPCASEVWGKVMFLHLSVIQRGRVVCLLGGGGTNYCLLGGVPTRGLGGRVWYPTGTKGRHPMVVTSSGGQWSWWYASFWNTYLFILFCVICKICTLNSFHLFCR